MKKLLVLSCLIIAAAMLYAPVDARDKKVVLKTPSLKLFLDYNVYTPSSTYYNLRGEIAGELTKDGHVLAHSADNADRTIQVGGVVTSQQKTEFGAACFYSVEVSVSIMIDRGAYASRIFETTITEQGKHTAGFHEAAVEAYKRMTPLVCETIKQHLQ